MRYWCTFIHAATIPYGCDIFSGIGAPGSEIYINIFSTDKSYYPEMWNSGPVWFRDSISTKKILDIEKVLTADNSVRVYLWITYYKYDELCRETKDRGFYVQELLLKAVREYHKDLHPFVSMVMTLRQVQEIGMITGWAEDSHKPVRPISFFTNHHYSQPLCSLCSLWVKLLPRDRLQYTN